MALIQHVEDEETLDRLARLLVREYDVQPLWLYKIGGFREYDDPIFEGPLRLSTLNRLYEGNWQADVIEGLLRNITTGGQLVFAETAQGGIRPTRQGRTPVRRVKVDPTRVAEVMKVFAQERMDLTVPEALGIASSVAKQGVPTDFLRRNLSIVRRWRDDTSQQEALSNIDVIVIASTAARQGVRFNSAEDIVAVQAPQLAERASREQAVLEARERGEPTLQTHPGVSVGGELTTIEQTGGAPASQSIAALATMAPGKARSEIKRLYPNLVEDGNDWAAVIRDIERTITIEETAWRNHWLYKWVMEPMLNLVTDFTQAAESVAVDIGLKTLSTIKDIAGDDEGADAMYRLSFKRAEQVARGKESLASVLQKDLGVSPWLAYPIQFAYDIWVDPFIRGGRALRMWRSSRVAPRLLERDTLLTRIGKSVPVVRNYVERALQTKRDLHFALYMGRVARLTDEATPGLVSAIESGRPGAIGEFIRTWRRGFQEERSPWSQRYLEEFAAAARAELRAGKLDSFGLKLETERAVISHFTATAPPGTLAERALLAAKSADEVARRAFVNDVDLLARRAAETQRPAIVRPTETAMPVPSETRLFVPGQATPGDPSQLIVPNRPVPADEGALLIGDPAITPEAAIRAADDALSAQIGPLDLWEAPLRLEVPTRVRALPGLGLTPWGRNKLVNVGLVDTAVGRQVNRLININPGNLLKMHEEPERFFRLRATRAKLPSDRAAYYEREATRAGGILGAARENRLTDLVREMNEEIIDRWTRRWQWADDAQRQQFADQALTDLHQASDEATRDLFGVVQRGDPGLVGPKAFNTPIARTQLRNFLITADPIDITRQLNRAVGMLGRFRGAVGRAFGKAPTARRLGVGEAQLLIDVWKQARAGILRTWKLGVVARPAYIFRVILGDELFRSIAVTGSIFERLMAQEFKGQVFGLGGFKTEATAGERFILGLPKGKRAGDLLDKWIYDDVVFPDGSTLRVGRAGAFERDARANPLLTQQTLVEDTMRDATRAYNAEVKANTYDVLTFERPGYHEAWAHALNNQFGRSETGRRILAHVLQGNTPAYAKRDLLESWVTGPGRAERVSIGVANENVAEWVNDYVDVVFAYTIGRPAVAHNALLHGLGPDDLRVIPNEFKPPIHGPLLEAISKNGQGFLKDATEGWYKLWVRNPENILNRQPFYRLWKRRAQLSMAEVAKQQGVKLTDELKAAIDNASTDFALSQTKAIMFDFTENTRIGELLGFVAPFMQPFLENFAVWGHILYRRNPALLGYVRELWRTGEETGFISKDEDTGERVIPLGWFGFGIVPFLMSKAIGGEGWKLTAPLTSFNMFYNSAFDVPIGGGATVPIPTPSLAPWALAPLQAVFKDTTNESLYDYLFQFGPGPRNVGEFAVSLLPSWLEKTLGTLFPGALPNVASDTVPEMLRMQQDLGQEPNVERAETQARWMAAFRTLMSFAFPASAQVKYPHDELTVEWHNLLEQHDGDFLKAEETFLTRHPGHELITVGATYWGKEIAGLEALRVPTTELSRRVLSSPGFREFAREHPLWAGALIAGAQTDDFDMGAFMAQVTEGDIIYKTGEQFMRDADEREFWAASTLIREQHNRRLERFEAGLISSQDFAYSRETDRYQKALLDLYNQYPRLSAEFLDPVEDPATGEFIGAVWKSPSGLPEVIHALKVQEVMQNPVFMDLPAGKGLGRYWEIREEARKALEKGGFYSIEQQEAGGIRRRYTEQTKALLEEIPEFRPAFEAWFEDFDLRSLPLNEGSRWLRNLETKAERGDEKAIAKLETYVEARRSLDRLRHLPSRTGTDAERTEAYARRRGYANQLMEASPWVMERWWDEQSHGERQVYLDGIRFLPVEFMSRFDLKLMGLKLTDKAARWWEQVGETSLASAQRKEADPSQTTGELFDRRDKFIREHLNEDESFRRVVMAANTPGFGVMALGWHRGDSKAAWAWRQVIQIADYARRVAVKEELGGTEPPGEFDPDKKKRYNEMQDILRTYADGYREWSPVFDRQWLDLQRHANRGEPLIYTFLPSVYFGPVGGAFPPEPKWARDGAGRQDTSAYTEGAVPTGRPGRRIGGERLRVMLERVSRGPNRPLTVAAADPDVDRDVLQRAVRWVNEQVGGRALRIKGGEEADVIVTAWNNPHPNVLGRGEVPRTGYGAQRLHRVWLRPEVAKTSKKAVREFERMWQEAWENEPEARRTLERGDVELQLENPNETPLDPDTSVVAHELLHSLGLHHGIFQYDPGPYVRVHPAFIAGTSLFLSAAEIAVIRRITGLG